MKNQVPSHLHTRKHPFAIALSAIAFPCTGLLCGALLSLTLPNSRSNADPNPGPFVPTLHSNTASHALSPHNRHLHLSHSSAPQTIPRSAQPIQRTSHQRPAPSRQHISNSAATPSTAPITESNSGFGNQPNPHPESNPNLGFGSGKNNESGLGHFEFHRFDPCQLTPNDFASSGLPAMVPGGRSILNPVDSKGTTNYQSAGKDLVATYCSYFNQNILANRHFNVSKESYHDSGAPLSLTDAKAVIKDNVKANFNGTAVFDSTTINGHPALVISGYDPSGGVVNYGIYVNGVLFEYYSNVSLFSVNYLNSTDLLALKDFVAKVTKTDPDAGPDSHSANSR